MNCALLNLTKQPVQQIEKVDPEIDVYRSAGAVTIVDNSDGGYLATGSWTPWDQGGYEGDLDYAPGSDGPSSATWTFNGLSAGTYRVSATWDPHENRATDAPYTIQDGANPLAIVDVNQELAPSDFADDGALWEDLGIFTIGGTSASVADDATTTRARRTVRTTALLICMDRSLGVVSGSLARPGSPSKRRCRVLQLRRRSQHTEACRR